MDWEMDSLMLLSSIQKFYLISSTSKCPAKRFQVWGCIIFSGVVRVVYSLLAILFFFLVLPQHSSSHSRLISPVIAALVSICFSLTFVIYSTDFCIFSTSVTRPFLSIRHFCLLWNNESLTNKAFFVESCR